MFGLDSLVSGVLNLVNIASSCAIYEITPDGPSAYSTVIKKPQQNNQNENSDKCTELPQDPQYPQDEEYASPWEMPPLLCLKVSKQRDRALKKHALELSQSKLVWTHAINGSENEEYLPPKDFKFCFDYSTPFAIKALRVDDNLKKAYCEFVPSKLDEEVFWRQYFWHIEMLKCQVTDEYQGVAIDFDDIKETTQSSTKGANGFAIRRVPSFANETFCQEPNRVFHLPKRSVIVREYLRYRLRELRSTGRDHSSSVDFEQPCTYDSHPLNNNTIATPLKSTSPVKSQSDTKHNRTTRRVKFTLPDTNRFLRLEEIPLNTHLSSTQLVEGRARCKSM